MDKVLSARVSATILDQIGALAERLRTSKKNVIESAIRLYAKETKEAPHDVFSQTFGAWKRKKSASTLVDEARATFRASGMRHQR